MEADQIITWDELMKHDHQDDAWFIIDGYVYDVTKFAYEHPGGANALFQWAGRDATEMFKQIGHSNDASLKKEKLKIGQIESGPQTESYIEYFKIQDAEQREIEIQEVAKHSTPESLWIIYQNRVYDVTQFLDDHPGGRKLILNFAGRDATKAFNAKNHSQSAQKLLEKFLIGRVQVNEITPFAKRMVQLHVLIDVSIFLGSLIISQLAKSQ